MTLAAVRRKTALALAGHITDLATAYRVAHGDARGAVEPSLVARRKFHKAFPPYFPQDLHPPFLAGFFAALTGFAAFAALVAFFVTFATFAATFFALMVPILGSSFV